MGQVNGQGCTHLLRFLTIAYAVGPRKWEMLKLEWPDVGMRRQEFTLRKTKNGETRVVSYDFGRVRRFRRAP